MAFKTIKNNISCVIPFYNEDIVCLRKTINILLEIEQVDKIIVVDDGSELRITYEFLKDFFFKNSKVKIVRLSKNYGKSFAVKFGISLSFSQNIFLLDADLKKLDKDQIIVALNEFKTQDLDMVILRRKNSLPLIKMLRGDVLLSGERIIKKSHLQNILRSNVEGYQLELATNQYFMENSLLYKCKWSPSSAKNDYKHKKDRFLKGIVKDLKMYFNIINYVGLLNFKKQISSFCKERI